MSSNKNNLPCISEHEEQKQLILLFRLKYPSLCNRLFAIPNGGLRNIKVAQKLKSEGVLPGVADLFLMQASNNYHGLFIEMKRSNGGHQTQAQKYFEKEAKNAGFCYVIANGCDEAINFIDNYLAGDK